MYFTNADMNRIKVSIDLLLLDITEMIGDAKPGSVMQESLKRERNEYTKLLEKVKEVINDAGEI